MQMPLFMSAPSGHPEEASVTNAALDPGFTPG